jgi:hypothetical protein
MLILSDPAVSATLTNATAETVLKSAVLPKNFLTAGKRIKVKSLVTIPSTNSTDTLTVRIRVGPTTLTGTVVCTTGAVDAANGDIAMVEAEILVRSVGTAGVIIVDGKAGLDAPGVALGAHGQVVTAVNSEAALRVEVTGAWSVASASNQCAAEYLTIEETAGADLL